MCILQCFEINIIVLNIQTIFLPFCIFIKYPVKQIHYAYFSIDIFNNKHKLEKYKKRRVNNAGKTNKHRTW